MGERVRPSVEGPKSEKNIILPEPQVLCLSSLQSYFKPNCRDPAPMLCLLNDPAPQVGRDDAHGLSLFLGAG